MDRKINTAKEYLAQIQSLNFRIKTLASQRQSLEDSLMNISPTLSHMPKAPSPDVHRMDGLIAAKLDIENKMEAASEKLAEVHKTIAAIPEAELSAVLIYRYVDRLQWADIATNLYLGVSRVYQLHREALAEVEKAINKAA